MIISFYHSLIKALLHLSINQKKDLKRNINILPLTLIICILLASCENWLDINQDPDSPQEVGYEELLPAGISSIAYVMGGRYQVLGALWSQHWTQSPGASQYSGLDSYDINSSTFDQNQFGELYSGALQNLERVRLESFVEGEYNYYLISTVVQCYIYQVLADLYDQVPFSEALKGDEGITEPVYESGEDIYDSLIARIDFALALDFNKEGLIDPEEKDLVFGGDIEKWKDFANTLKLRLFIRQSGVGPSKAQQGIEAMYDAGCGFLENDATLDIFTDESGRRNPLYDTEYFTFGKNPNLILSQTLYGFLNKNRDFQRLNSLFNNPANGGGHKALAQGNYYAPDEAAGINSSSYSKPVMEPSAPVFLMSAAESYLLQAEAIIRYKVDDYGRAKDLYEQAVIESYARVLITDAEAHAEIFYNGAYAFPAEGSMPDSFIESIATQKWLSLSGIQNLETFFELNRTGYPKISDVPADDPAYKVGELTVSVNNVTSGKFPKRLVFPESEYANNRNTPAFKEVWQNVWWDID